MRHSHIFSFYFLTSLSFSFSLSLSLFYSCLFGIRWFFLSRDWNIQREGKRERKGMVRKRFLSQLYSSGINHWKKKEKDWEKMFAANSISLKIHKSKNRFEFQFTFIALSISPFFSSLFLFPFSLSITFHNEWILNKHNGDGWEDELEWERERERERESDSQSNHTKIVPFEICSHFLDLSLSLSITPSYSLSLSLSLTHCTQLSSSLFVCYSRRRRGKKEGQDFLGKLFSAPFVYTVIEFWRKRGDQNFVRYRKKGKRKNREKEDEERQRKKIRRWKWKRRYLFHPVLDSLSTSLSFLLSLSLFLSHPLFYSFFLSLEESWISMVKLIRIESQEMFSFRVTNDGLFLLFLSVFSSLLLSLPFCFSLLTLFSFPSSSKEGSLSSIFQWMKECF